MTLATAEPERADAGATRPCRFVLLCHQRSGSNALAAVLNDDPRVFLYGQLFSHFVEYYRRNARLGYGSFRVHPEAMRHFGRKPPVRYRLERLALAAMPVERDLDRFLARFWSRPACRPSEDRPIGAAGFKLHDYQLGDDDLARLATAHVDGVVMLRRRNLLKAAVSWAYAIKTDVWSRRGAATGPAPVHALDVDEVAWFVDKTARTVEHWRGLLDRSGARWLELVYEDHVEPLALEGLYDFLGVEWHGPLAFRTERLSRADYAHVANAREIDRALGDDATGRLFS